ATHIELREDSAEEDTRTNSRPRPVERIRNPSPDRGSLERAAQVIQKADRPVGLAGAGVLRSGASDELRRFAEGLGIPVAHTFMGKGGWPGPPPRTPWPMGFLPGASGPPGSASPAWASVSASVLAGTTPQP